MFSQGNNYQLKDREPDKYDRNQDVWHASQAVDNFLNTRTDNKLNCNFK